MSRMILSLLATAGFVLAQNSDGGWRRIGDNPTNQPPADQPPAYQAAVPPELTIPAGAFVTVRVNQVLSSDRNQQGDAFSATLESPIVVDGILVAQRGETLAGRVAEAQKAGRVSGTSRLGVELTDLTLVDGQQVPIQSQLITRNGRTSEGRDVAAVATTTGVGAAVGAAADYGRGAAIGAGAGAAAGILGVLLTRGHPTILTPESVLTFRLTAAIPVSTERAPQAFRTVDPNQYNQPAPPRLQSRAPGYGPPPPYYAPYPYYPYYWGPTIGVYYGPRFFGPRGGRFYGRR